MFTARIRRMGEGNVFDTCLSFCLSTGGGGVSPAGGGGQVSPAGGGGQVSPARGVRSVQPGGVKPR